MYHYLKSLLLVACLGMMAACSGKHQKKPQTPKSKGGVVNNPKFGKWQDSPTPPITFTKTLTIGNQSNHLLSSYYNLVGPVVDAAGNIYFIDANAGKMYSFNPDGTLRWKKGHLGKGPGAFKNPRGLAIDDKYIYTANISGTRIDKFNLNGKFITGKLLHKYDINFASIKGLIADSLLVIKSSITGKLGDKITLLDTSDSLKKVSQFNIEFGKSPGISSSATLPLHVTNSRLVIANRTNYVIWFYNINGKKIKTVKRTFNKFLSNGIGSSNHVIRICPSYSYLSAPISLHNGYYITTLNWATNIKDPDRACKEGKKPIYKNSIDLYNKDGTLLYSWVNKGKNSPIGHIAYVDSKGNIYTKTNKPFPQIRRYKVTIQPPAGR